MSKKRKQLEFVQGIYPSFPRQDFIDMDALSYSGVKRISKSPAQYLTATPQTPAMASGVAFHKYILEHDTFSDEYIVNQHKRNTKAGKEIEAKAAKEGKQTITFAEYKTFMEMRIAVGSHSKVSSLMQAGSSEVAVLWNSGKEQCKALVDWYIPDAGDGAIAIDFKKTKDVHPNDFARSVANFGYHIQAAFTLDGLAACGVNARFFFVACEAEAPYHVFLYELNKEAIAAGRKKYQQALKKWAMCKALNDWGKGDEGIIEIELPRWTL